MDDFEYLERALEKPKSANELEPPLRDQGRAEKHRSRSRSRDRRRERDRDSNRDRERDRDRGERGDRDRRRSRSRDREKRRSRSRDKYRDRDRRGDWNRKAREITPPEERLARDEERRREKELKEMERAARTVFATNVNLKADERDIFKWFSQAGTVTDIQLITDKNTRKSKGIAYIEFSTQEGAITAITVLNGQLFMHQPVMIKGSEVEKNLAWEAQQAAKLQAQQQHNQQAAAALSFMLNPSLGVAAPSLTIPSGLGSCRLQVSNLHPGLDESDLKQAFEPFGFLETIEVSRDQNKKSLGVGFVQFREFTDGAKAIQHWNGRQLGGRALEVQVAPLNLQPPMLTSGSSLLSGFQSGLPPGAAASFGAAVGTGQVTETSFAAAFLAQQGLAGINELDEADEEGKGGLRLDAQKRMALMQRLAATAGISGPAPSQVLQPSAVVAPVAPQAPASVSWDQGFLGPASPIPTPCILLKNMFDASQEEARAREEGAPDPANHWVREVEDDVREECSRFGEVKHIFLDRNSSGFVYVKFADQHGASAAHRALNGRFYSGKQLVVEYQFLHTYNAYFKIQ